MKQEESPNESLKSVKKTMRLLELLSSNEELGISELAKETGESKGTLFRFMNTLKSLGYVSQNPQTEKYRITLALFSMAASAVRRYSPVREAEPFLEQLAGKTNETIHFAALKDSGVVYLHKIESTHGLRVSMGSYAGGTAPAYCTGLGKVLLAHSEDPKNILDSLTLRPFTEKTITDELSLLLELERIEQRGYAYDDEENEIGVRCIAAPVFDHLGEASFAVSLSGPSVRITDKVRDTLRELVLNTARKISAALGYREHSGKENI